MKRGIIWIIGILLISSSLSVSSFLNREHDLGEVVAVSADHIEPVTVSSNYLKARNYPVMVFLRGFTLGSILFGDDAPEVDPFFGGLNIRDFTIHLNDGRQYATVSKPIFPRGDNLRIGQNGEIDLGHMIVQLKRNAKEAEIPEEIKLNLTAKFIFDSVSKFGIFGQQDLILTPMKENNFLNDPSSGKFWSGRGYVRLDNVEDGEARLELYDGSFKTISNFKIKEGKEKGYSIRGGPYFLDNKLRVKLKDILTPQTNAVLIIDDEESGLTRTTVVQGMRPFVGSSWTVKRIITTPKKTVEFIHDNGEVRALGGESTPDLDPCINEVHINEKYLGQNLKEAEDKQRRCTALEEYEQALVYVVDPEKKEEIYLKISQTYEKLGAYVKSLEYYKKISSGMESNIVVLEDMIEEKAPNLVLDDVIVFLESIEEVTETSYFLARVGESLDIENKEEVMNLISNKAEEFNVPVDVALAVAKHESNFKHCKDNSYSCDVLSEILTNPNIGSSGNIASTDHGIFQINDKAHGGCFDKDSSNRGICSVSECNGRTVSDLECNIAAALKLLKNNYNSYEGDYDSYKENVEQYCTDSNYLPKYLSYEGWDIALRAYNGLGCTSAVANYVETINSYKESDEIKNFEISSLTGGEKTYIINDRLIKGSLFNLKDSNGNTYDWRVDDILEDKITLRTAPKSASGGGTYTLRRGSNTIDGVSVYVSDINYEKAALVSILPGSGRAYGSSDFTVTIPIEKRLITWTPEEIDKKIKKTSDTLEKIDKSLENLGNMIKWWKGGCFVTYSTLVLKNLKSLAPRKDAIIHFTKRCKDEIDEDNTRYNGTGIPDKINSCLEYYELKDDGIKNYMAGYSMGIDIGEEFLKLKKDKGLDHQDTKNFLKNYFNLTTDNDEKLLDFIVEYNNYTRELKVGSVITSDKIKKYILEKETGDSDYLSNRNDLFDVSLLEKYQKIDGLVKGIDSSLNEQEKHDARVGIIKSILKTKKTKEYNDYSDSDKKNRLKSILDSKGQTEMNYFEKEKVDGDKATVYIDGVETELEVIKSEDIGVLDLDGDTFYRDSEGNVYSIGFTEEFIYGDEFKDSNKILLNNDNKVWIFPYPFGERFEFRDNAHTYNANYVRVYFDGNKRTYSINNVGADGRIDYNRDYGIKQKDDKMILLPSEFEVGTYVNLKQDLDGYYNDLERKVADKPKNNKIKFAGKEFIVGLASDSFNKFTAENSCQFYMSAEECKLMYNVCDPVMCPTGRFDFGGKRKVDNVISTGIIGSFILGMPNWKVFGGDMVVPPVCVSGVHAGLDNLKTGFLGYQDCLQKAKIDGEYVGVCDEITGIYACEMLWREAIALTDLAGSATDLLGIGLQKRLDLSKSGEDNYFEFGSINEMWDDVKSATNQFTSQYAASSFTSFAQRSSEGFGTQICKAAIHGKIPSGGDLLSQLTEPTSPPQFVAWYDKRDHSGVDGGLSTYNIYYHIYSGRDKKIRYNVYLLSPQGKARGVMDDNAVFSGPRVLEKGEYVDKTVVVVDSSSFDKLCVDIDGAVHCGFGKVTSSEGIVALNDLIIEAEVKQNVTNSNECAPEHPSLVPGTGGIVGSIVAPAASGLVESGVVKICSPTGDPDGVGDRWKKVGTCGEDEFGFWQGDCYIDVNSLDLKGYRGEAVEDFLDNSTKAEMEELTQNEQESNKSIEDILVKFNGEISKKSLDNKDINKIVDIILKLRSIIESSQTMGPMSRAYVLIGDIYSKYEPKIVAGTEDTSGGGQTGASGSQTTSNDVWNFRSYYKDTILNELGGVYSEEEKWSQWNVLTSGVAIPSSQQNILNSLENKNQEQGLNHLENNGYELCNPIGSCEYYAEKKALTDIKDLYYPIPYGEEGSIREYKKIQFKVVQQSGSSQTQQTQTGATGSQTTGGTVTTTSSSCEIEYSGNDMEITFSLIDGIWKWIDKSPSWQDYGYRSLDLSSLTDDYPQGINLGIFPNLFSRLTEVNQNPSLGNTFDRGTNYLVGFANHGYQENGPNDHYLKIGESKFGDCWTDDCHSRYISVDDVLTSCDGQDRSMNCIIEYDENDWNDDWLFSFHNDYLGGGEKIWYIKSEEDNDERGEFNNKWLSINQINCDKRKNVFYQTPGANYELCIKLKETNEKTISETSKFEEGVETLISHADEVGEGDDELLVYYLGEKKYNKISPDIDKTKIFEACKY